MIERIKFIQETKIDELLTLIKDEGEKEYTVKAPTGSGKTYMQGYLINKLLEKYPNSKIIYQTLSKAGLPIQAFNSITDKFKNNFKNINAILLSTNHSNEERISISENYNTYFLPKQLNIKGGNLENPLKDFLIYKTKNCQKFLIIDECHEKATNIMKYENEFDYVFNFSATPKKEQTKPGRFVELEEEVCEKYNLIKTKVIDDKEVDILKTDGTLDTNKLKNRIQKSISKFVSIQNDYKGTNINPAMVIQISNDFKGLDELKIILEELNKKDLLWYFEATIKDKNFENEINYRNGFASNDRVSLLTGIEAKEKAREYIKQNFSTIPVVIFKLAFKEGFDMPRACYLLQIRSTQSETLNEQVIGRIRRNPCLVDFDDFSKEQQQKIMKAYIDGVVQQDTKEIEFVKRNHSLEIETTKLKNKVPMKIKNISKIVLKDVGIENIFELKQKWDKLDGQIKLSLKNISKEEWIKYCLSVENINKEYFEEDYKNNIISDGKKEIQNETFYRIDKYQTDISSWIWNHSSNQTSKRYSFESDAEKEVAHDLARLKLSLWGKNFYNGSKISFEYFLNQKGNILISNQHPDFLIEKNGKKYLVEVKSYRKSNEISLDNDDYKTKVESIKKMYKESSRVTKNQVYVMIIAENNGGWASYCYENGKEDTFYNDDRFNFLTE